MLLHHQVVFCKWVVLLSSLLSPEDWKRERWCSMGPARAPATGCLWLYSPSFCSFFFLMFLAFFPILPISQFLTDNILNSVFLPYPQLLRRKCIVVFCTSTEESHRGWWELRLSVGEWFFLSLSSSVVGCCASPPTGHVEQGGACATGLYSASSSFQYLFWIPSISKQWVGAALPTGWLTLG